MVWTRNQSFVWSHPRSSRRKAFFKILFLGFGQNRWIFPYCGYKISLFGSQFARKLQWPNLFPLTGDILLLGISTVGEFYCNLILLSSVFSKTKSNPPSSSKLAASKKPFIMWFFSTVVFWIKIKYSFSLNRSWQLFS